MKRTVLIETLILFCIGIISGIEAMRLILFKDPNVLYDKVGPGFLVLFVSVTLIITGTCHFFTSHRESDGEKAVMTDKEATIQVVNTIFAGATYILLISIIGYIMASFIFFMAQLAIFGVRPWKTTAWVAALLTIVYYFVFIEFCSMVFPRGYLSPLFEWFKNLF